MEIESNLINKERGIYYTPPVLAEYLAQPLVKSGNLSIFDPSYGKGALLLAAEKIFKDSVKVPYKIHLHGCDIKPLNGLLNHLPKGNLKEIDFFWYPLKRKHDLILTNPPYVRHHLQDKETINLYRSLYPEFRILNNSADLWAFFLIKSVLHLNKGGCIGAILPWAFLQADYAQPLRKWLSEMFAEIKLLALKHRYFESADERVVLVWLKKYGQQCKSIKIASAKDIDSNISFSKLPLSNWISNKVFYIGNNRVEKLLSIYKAKFGFSEFEKHADVKIGVVTGADDFFIRSPLETRKLGFKKQHLIPILTSSRQFSELSLNGVTNVHRLIYIKPKDYTQFEKFISSGIKKRYHLRAHSKLREPWYSVKVGKIADAFFPYRIGKIPYLVRNELQIQCTNSIHRIYFKNLSEVEIKWIQVSLLSVPSQLSLETTSKTYGRGMLKMEPSSLKRALVLKRNDDTINTVYPQIIELISEKKKEDAMQLATDFINRELNIPTKLSIAATKLWQEFQNLRLP